MMETETIAPGTALALIETMTPMEIYSAGAAQSWLDTVDADVRAQIPKLDASTDKGRKAIGSLADKVSTAKVKYDNMGKALTEDIDKQRNAVLAERRRGREMLEQLRDDVLAPREAYKAIQAKRVAAHEMAVQQISDMRFIPDGMNSARLADHIERVKLLHLSRDFEEFVTKAADARAATIGYLLIALGDLVKREADEFDARRLAAAKAEEDRLAAIEARRLRDKAIADQAAETARIAAENKAREEREAEAKRVEAERLAAERRAEEAAQAIREAAERAGREAQIREATAEAARLKAVRDAKEAREREEKRRVHNHERSIESVQGMIRDACSTFNNSGLIEHIRQMIGEMDEAKRDYEEFQERFDAVMKDGREQIDKRLADVKEAERQATERANQVAAANAEIQRQAAIEAERQRVAAEASEKAAGDAKRAKDAAHRKAVNGAARDALVAKGLSVEHATIAVTAIAKGDVPGATINY